MNEPTTGTNLPDSAQPAAVGASLRDKAGRLFDAAKNIFKVHPKTGRWMPKGGRKPKTMTSTPAAPGQAGTAALEREAFDRLATEAERQATLQEKPAPTAEPTPQPAAPDFSDIKKLLETPDPPPTTGAPKFTGDEYTLAAAGTVAGISTLAILAMGAHVKPDNEQTAAMVDAYAAAFRHYGYKPEVPPWLGPVIATAVWVGPHFSDARSQTSLQSWKRKIANAWLWITGKLDGRAAVKASEAAHR